MGKFGFLLMLAVIAATVMDHPDRGRCFSRSRAALLPLI